METAVSGGCKRCEIRSCHFFQGNKELFMDFSLDAGCTGECDMGKNGFVVLRPPFKDNKTVLLGKPLRYHTKFIALAR